MNKFLVAVAAVLVLAYSSVFVVQQNERGLVLRFGKVLRDSHNVPIVYGPGLHFKLPLIEQVKRLDARIQTLDNKADRFVTKEKKDLIIDSYIKWRISDFSRYYLVTGGGSITQAESLLKRKFDDRLRSLIGSKDIKDIVTDSRGQLMKDVLNELNTGTISADDTSSDNSTNVTDKTKESTTSTTTTTNTSSTVNPNSMAALGIQVVDVRIKQINLPNEVYDAIYKRMRAEREAVARRHRSQGLEEAEKIRATADYEADRTVAAADKQALIIRGEGDAEAAKLYANTFGKDPEFYAFIRSLQVYQNSFKGNNDIMVLKPDSDFFRYMRSPAPAK